MARGRDDLDLAWKEALTGFLPGFLQLFLPHVHEAVDWSRPVVFLEGELRRLRRRVKGRRTRADVVVELCLRSGEHALVVVHVEVQSQRDDLLPLRMRLYNDSVAVLGDSLPEWRPSRYELQVWECRSSLDYPVIKLLRPVSAACPMASGPPWTGCPTWWPWSA